MSADKVLAAAAWILVASWATFWLVGFLALLGVLQF